MSRDDVMKWLSGPEMAATGVCSAMQEKWAEDIGRRYSEEWRHYHTLNHLADMMNHYQTWKDHITDHVAMVLAIFSSMTLYTFPNLAQMKVTVSTSSRNFLMTYNWQAEEMRVKVDQLITATIHHIPDDSARQNSDLAFFLDFDMAILGQSQQVYDVYAVHIQKEYCHMDSKGYCLGRTKVLQSFLERPRIYATNELREAFEDQARRNMQREIASLQMQVPQT